MSVLGFRRNEFALDSERHVQYFNRHFGYVLRPARKSLAHEPYGPGLHHLCLRVNSPEDVHEAARLLKLRGIEVSAVGHHPEYAPDYFACFLSDPDGIRLEITNYRAERKERHDRWGELYSRDRT
jgi:glyoxylase I family protein